MKYIFSAQITQIWLHTIVGDDHVEFSFNETQIGLKIKIQFRLTKKIEYQTKIIIHKDGFEHFMYLFGS